MNDRWNIVGRHDCEKLSVFQKNFENSALILFHYLSFIWISRNWFSYAVFFFGECKRKQRIKSEATISKRSTTKSSNWKRPLITTEKKLQSDSWNADNNHVGESRILKAIGVASVHIRRETARVSKLAGERMMVEGKRRDMKSWCNATLAVRLPYQSGYLDASTNFHGIEWRICVCFDSVFSRDRACTNSDVAFLFMYQHRCWHYDCVHSLYVRTDTHTHTLILFFIQFIYYVLPSVPYTNILWFPEIKTVMLRDKNKKIAMENKRTGWLWMLSITTSSPT